MSYSDDDRRKYHGDVSYEVWRSGGNPDRVDYDRIEDRRYDGYDAESAASAELRRQRESIAQQTIEEPDAQA